MNATATTLQEMNTIYAMIINITWSKQVYWNVSQIVGTMRKIIENLRVTLNQKENGFVYGSESSSDVDETLSREEVNTEEKTLQLSSKSLFKKDFSTICM